MTRQIIVILIYIGTVGKKVGISFSKKLLSAEERAQKWLLCMLTSDEQISPASFAFEIVKFHLLENSKDFRALKDTHAQERKGEDFSYKRGLVVLLVCSSDALMHKGHCRLMKCRYADLVYTSK